MVLSSFVRSTTSSLIRHCCSIRQLLPWIMAFRCHFIMPLIMTVQLPTILYVLQLPRDSVLGSFRWRFPSISLWRWRLICSCFKETLSQKTLEFEGDLSILVVLRVELDLYCLGSSYQIHSKMWYLDTKYSTADCALCTTDYGLRTVHYGLCAADYGLCI